MKPARPPRGERVSRAGVASVRHEVPDGQSSAVGWQATLPAPPGRSVMTVRNQRLSSDPLNGWSVSGLGD